MIPSTTIKAANVALWQMGKFNQLVDQQAQFNALHAAEIVDPFVVGPRREVLAKAAFELCDLAHRYGIGDNAWYKNLEKVLDKDISSLERWEAAGWKQSQRPEGV